MAYIGSLNDRFCKILIINALHKTSKNATERLHAQTGMSIGKAQFLYIYTFRTLSLHFLFYAIGLRHILRAIVVL